VLLSAENPGVSDRILDRIMIESSSNSKIFVLSRHLNYPLFKGLALPLTSVILKPLLF